jgi:hypothetical protein
MSDFDPVQEYAKVRLALSQARRSALQSQGHTETTLRDLEAKALAHVTDSLATEFGVLQVVSTPIYAHKNSEVIDTVQRLHFTTKGG